jgi:hypothetical protein
MFQVTALTVASQTFAASAGRILDICVRPGDTTVQGSNYPNQNIEIHLGLPV